MGIETGIQWTNHSWNVARGCSKIDEDCRYCYLYRQSLKGKRYDPRKVKKTKTVFRLPLKTSEPSLFFTSSLTDFFHDEIDSYRHEAWDIIRSTPHHTYQILTKRPERIAQCLPLDWGTGWDNVWLGTSVGNPDAINRIYELIKIKAKIHFVSFEPLWKRIDLKGVTRDVLSQIDWAIIGGESGNENGQYRYRPCQLEWLESLIDELKPTTQVFVKQLGTYLSKQLKLSDRHGGNINEWPDHLRIRQMPKHFTGRLLDELHHEMVGG